jgi:dihydrofolate reductase
MSKLKVANFSMSADGFSAGPGQSLQNPLGVDGHSLHKWFLPTHTFQQMIRGADGEKGTDDDMAKKAFVNVGAVIMGRNMFSPDRGPWAKEEWKGWWGANPPYHCPVFILTHHARPSIEMEGGTVFHFVTEGIESALEQARAAAGGKDVLLSGGAHTLNQYLRAGLIDQMHMAISPTILGSGARLFEGVDLRACGYKLTSHICSEKAMHLIIEKEG